jgi:hypothetical protein
MRWAGHVVSIGERRGVYRVLVGKPDGKRQLGRPRRRWEDNIKMDLQEVGSGDVDWIELAEDRVSWRALVNAVMNLGFHKLRGLTPNPGDLNHCQNCTPASEDGLKESPKHVRQK